MVKKRILKFIPFTLILAFLHVQVVSCSTAKKTPGFNHSVKSSAKVKNNGYLLTKVFSRHHADVQRKNQCSLTTKTLTIAGIY